MNKFYVNKPTVENYWRSINLFGKNVASYKFALAKALYDLKSNSKDLITMDELSQPYVKHLLEHLKTNPKQITSSSSRFLSACVDYNNGEISYDELLPITKKLGFQNVIDAFHNVHGEEIKERFFIDERKGAGGIRITDNFYKLMEVSSIKDIMDEVDSRWRLVETGWELQISSQLIKSVEYDEVTKDFYIIQNEKRVDVTSSRGALNGYQKGKCFYCYDTISIQSGAENLAEVDHFFPWRLKEIPNINGVWNLVLACKKCNRGEKHGKFDKLPSIELLEKLSKRNEYLIESYLPLKETLKSQTGNTRELRHEYLQNCYNVASRLHSSSWSVHELRGDPTF